MMECMKYDTVWFEQKFLRVRPNALRIDQMCPSHCSGKMCSNKEKLRDSEDSIPM